MSLVSVVVVKSPVKSENEMIDDEEKCFLIFSKTLLSLSIKINSLLALLSSCTRAIKVENVSVRTRSYRR